jgi:tight adherence protein C
VSVDGPPAIVWLLLGAAAFALAVWGLRGLLDIRAALRAGELERLSSPPRWPVTRAAAGCLPALPVWLVTSSLGPTRWLAAAAVAALGVAVAPRFLEAARARVADELRDELPLHLELIALALEGGGTLPGAIALCAEHAPEGALRRAWGRVLLDIHGGAEPLEALRAFEERLGFKLFGHLLTALRSAERLGFPAAMVLREKARQAAAQRFARAEHLARTAPLKLWATLMLCIAPCTLVVLAFPFAKLLAIAAGG